MSRKTRVFIANDASHLGTGYAVYGKELLSRLQNSGKFEVAELACYVHAEDEKIKNTPWKVYPNAPTPGDGEKQKNEHQYYTANAINQFGAWRFNAAIAHFKPDIVFDIRDYWMFSYQEASFFRPYFRWVVMPTVDSAPQKLSWLDTFANMDLIVPYTRWAYNTLQNQCGNRINLFNQIANAGINPSEFAPSINKKEHQRQIFGKELSITGSVMRNQKRKLFADLLHAYRAYLDRLISEDQIDLYEKSYLYLHTSYPESHGWELTELLLESNMFDKTYFTYGCQKCKYVEPKKFTDSIAKCPKCGYRSMMMPNASNPVKTETLNSVYNTFDFYVQYAICEGFGMPQLEAASAAVPIASVDYSAMSEIVRNLHGYPIPVQRLFRELETTANRAYPDNDSLVNILYDFFVRKTQEERNAMGKKARESCIELYTWDKVYNTWVNAFESVDISTNIPWDQPNPNPIATDTNITGQKTPAGLIDHIILELLKEPYMLNASNIRDLKRGYTTGLYNDKNGVRTMKPSELVNELEKFMNWKVQAEDLRTKINEIDSEWLHV